MFRSPWFHSKVTGLVNGLERHCRGIIQHGVKSDQLQYISSTTICHVPL
uniref:Uncharacterized protein n=1 Tax=Anguilla anguilla TaxID=7936 RepID=A0A0E9W8K4_ANGAN